MSVTEVIELMPPHAQITRKCHLLIYQAELFKKHIKRLLIVTQQLTSFLFVDVYLVTFDFIVHLWADTAETIRISSC